MAEAKLLSLDLETALKHIVISNGDVSKLDNNTVVMLVRHILTNAGLNPDMAPCPIKLLESTKSNKCTLYAAREMAAALSDKRHLTVIITERKITEGMAIFGARVSEQGTARTTDGTGVCSVAGLVGDSAANKVMHAETKAKRRTILDHCGLGMLDESEIGSIEGAISKDIAAPVATQTPAQAATQTPAQAAPPPLPKPVTPPAPPAIAQPATETVDPKPAVAPPAPASPPPAVTAPTATTKDPKAIAAPEAVNAMVKAAAQVWDNKTLAEFLWRNYGVTNMNRKTTLTNEVLDLVVAAIEMKVKAKK